MSAVNKVLEIIDSYPISHRGLTFSQLVMSLDLDVGFVARDLLALGDDDFNTAIELIREWRVVKDGDTYRSMAHVAAVYALGGIPSAPSRP